MDFFCFGQCVAAHAASLTFTRKSNLINSSSELTGCADEYSSRGGSRPLNGDSIPDVAFVYRNNPTGKINWRPLGDINYSFRQKTDIATNCLKRTSLEATFGSLTLINDGRQDIVMLKSGPVRCSNESDGIFGRRTYTPLDTMASVLQISRLGSGSVLWILTETETWISSFNDFRRGNWMVQSGKGRHFRLSAALLTCPAESHFALGDLNERRNPGFGCDAC